MKRCLIASAAVLLAGPLTGQTVSTGDKQHVRLRAIGEKLKCQCGSRCSYTVGSCNMLNCHFRTEVYDQVRQDLSAGAEEATILAKLKKKYGTIILVSPPAEGFNLLAWAMPFVALAAGLLVVRAVLIRWRRPRRALAPLGPAVDKFRDQIEKEMAELE